MRLVVEADGGARGNPGPAGYGAVVRDAATGEVLAERAKAIGVATNNVAEYSGLIAGLAAAADLGAREVEVRMDSRLVIEQMSGRWQIKHPGLRPLAAEAARLVRRFDTVTFTWVPRQQNARADALANQAMDSAVAHQAISGELASQETGGVVVRQTRGDELASQPISGALVNQAVGGEPAAAAAPADVMASGQWQPATGTPTRFVLIRHGETERNVRRQYSGRAETPLTARGRTQARAAGRRLAALRAPIAAVVSSPLGRCVQTARELGTRAEIVLDEDLIECDFGEWEGLTAAQVRARWPAEMDAWLASTEVAPPGGESFAAVAVRVGRAMRRLHEAYLGQLVVVVSHVAPIKIALRDALGVGDSFLHRLYLDPAGLSVVDRYPDGGVAVRCINDTAHLSPRS